MANRTRHGSLLVFGLALLCFGAADTAVAQYQNTTEQIQKTDNLTNATVNLTHPEGKSRGSLDPWAPPDIDAVRPPVTQTASCSLPDVVSQAGVRVEEFVRSLDRFSATEIIQHQSVNHLGSLQRPEIRKSNYVFSMREDSNGYMITQEYRNRSTTRQEFPDEIETLGTSSLMLIFHPSYVQNFQMSCEGLGKWHGEPAWQIRFEQRPDCVNNMSSISIDWKTYKVNLRGRAWILADSYQLAHVETDLAETIPKIHLRLQHIAVDYLPVSFPTVNAGIWLPSSAELYLDFRGHRFYRRQTYTDFKLFSVKVQQRFGDLQ